MKKKPKMRRSKKHQPKHARKKPSKPVVNIPTPPDGGGVQRLHFGPWDMEHVESECSW